MARCRGTKADGTRCNAPPSLVGEDGYCSAHGPGAATRMADRGRRGAASYRDSLRRKGLDLDELPPLETHEDAERRLDLISQAVLAGRLSKGDAMAGTKAIDSWLKARGDRLAAQVVDQLRAEVDRIKAELGGRPRLRAAP